MHNEEIRKIMDFEKGTITFLEEEDYYGTGMSEEQTKTDG